MYSDYDTMRTMLRLANSPATFSLRRALFADGLVSLVASIGALNRVAERIDERLYPEYHQQPVGKPIYIVAAPRSGTTFLHRLMSRDPQFTTFKMLETFFPTITGQKVIERVTRVNGRVGGALNRLTELIDSSSFGAWEGIHDTGLNQDEEDEAIWAMAFATPAIWLVLPYPERFAHLRFIDKLPEDKKRKLIAYYRGVVQRHLHLRPGKTLLAKNVLLPGRFEIVTGALPDARFVHVLRHPYEALPSMLSLFTVPWRWHSPEVRPDGPEARALTELTIDYYRFLHSQSLESERQRKRQFFNVTYNDLLADPMKTVEQI
ncbi:MAG: sulfotransferase [Myxococcales bacterium]